MDGGRQRCHASYRHRGVHVQEGGWVEAGRQSRCATAAGSDERACVELNVYYSLSYVESKKKVSRDDAFRASHAAWAGGVPRLSV
eukprot:1159667-Pelagomonas_calceolata.AAC.3